MSPYLSLKFLHVLLAIIAITLMTYFLFRHIVYKPIDSLLLAMSTAEAGNLSVEVPPQAPDEIGLLTSRFNRMLGRIRQMTEQLNLEQRVLEVRVKEATAEIAERKEQLEDANLQLFEMQRQLTQLERLEEELAESDAVIAINRQELAGMSAILDKLKSKMTSFQSLEENIKINIFLKYFERP